MKQNTTLENIAQSILHTEKQEFLPLLDRPQKTNQSKITVMVDFCRKLLPKEKGIGSTITEL